MTPRLWAYIPMPTLPPEEDRDWKDNTYNPNNAKVCAFRARLYENQKTQYDAFVDLIGEDDWVWTQDDDCIHTDPRWHSQIRYAIERHGPMDMYVCYINRGAWGRNIPGPDEPKWPGMVTNDLDPHFAFGKYLADKYWGEVEDITDNPGHPGRMPGGKNRGLEGTCYVFSKKFIQATGPTAKWPIVAEGSFQEAVKRAGSRLWLLKGVYVYHKCAHYMKNQRRQFRRYDAWREKVLEKRGVTAQDRDLNMEALLEK